METGVIRKSEHHELSFDGTAFTLRSLHSPDNPIIAVFPANDGALSNAISAFQNAEHGIEDSEARFTQPMQPPKAPTVTFAAKHPFFASTNMSLTVWLIIGGLVVAIVGWIFASNATANAQFCGLTSSFSGQSCGSIAAIAIICFGLALFGAVCCVWGIQRAVTYFTAKH